MVGSIHAWSVSQWWLAADRVTARDRVRLLGDAMRGA